MTLAVGIDLGTTHCALSSADIGDDSAGPQAFPIPQVVRPGEVEERPLLPSFLYLPAQAELPAGALALPWDRARGYAVGAFARDNGVKVPARVVSSAKSWLCHAGIDRRAAVLPWGAPEEVPKVSPLEATARTLAHLREAWDAAHPDAALASQELVVTVPASFDAAARDLTLEAAEQAGVAWNMTLLEEPQAALYAWVAASEGSWRKALDVGELILVCDIGGGTTDFSLIAALETDGSLELHRVAVGDHLLLGGDNMDLALAFAMKAKLETGGRAIDEWQLRSLTAACRVAKESLLGDARLAAAPVVIPGRGSKLMGGALKTELSRPELEALVLDGFLPKVEASARTAARRTALTELGLPYASDAAITRHLAEFWGRQARAGASLPAGVVAEGRAFLHPTAILFNGGVTKAAPVRERIVALLDEWLAADGGRPVKVLAGDDADLAVARGAAYYGCVRQGRGIRIRGGTARAYYVGIERSELAVPGMPPRVDAVCIAPFGMEEGSEVELPQELGLLVGEPTAFRFFASSTRREDRAGDKVTPGPELEQMPPIETTLDGEAGQVVPVRLEARVTDVGTLELSAVEKSRDKRWKLSFDVRGR